MSLSIFHPYTSKPHPEHIKFPYFLRGLSAQAYSTDITYILLPNGFVCLCGVMDWYSRFVLSIRISNTMESLEALEEAVMKYGSCEIFNTDQGSQLTFSK